MERIESVRAGDGMKSSSIDNTEQGGRVRHTQRTPSAAKEYRGDEGRNGKTVRHIKSIDEVKQDMEDGMNRREVWRDSRGKGREVGAASNRRDGT